MPITFSALVYMGAPISQCGAWSRRPSTHKVVVLSSSPACCMFEEVQVSFREKNTRGWFGVYFSNAARRSGLRLLYVINFVPDSFFFFFMRLPDFGYSLRGNQISFKQTVFSSLFLFWPESPGNARNFREQFPRTQLPLGFTVFDGTPLHVTVTLSASLVA